MRWTGLLLAVLLLPPVARAARPQAPVIRHVRVESDTPLRRTDLPKVLGLTEGRPLDRRRLRQGIRALYAGGEVEGLEVDAERAGGSGIDVTVHVSFRARIARIRLRGVGLLWRTRVSAWLHLHKGDPFSGSALENGVRHILKALEDRGYLDATVEPDAAYDRPTNTVTVTISIHRNAIARVVGVRVRGAPSVREKLAAAAGLRPGSRLTLAHLDRARERVEATLRKLGFWGGEVADMEKRRVDGGVLVTIVVDAGARYTLDLHTVPDDEATRKMILDVLFHSSEPAPMHPAQLGLTTDWIRTRLQERGYLLARVTATLDRQSDPRRFELHVEPGPRSRIEDVVFRGAGPVKRHTLKKAVRIHRGKVGGLLRQKVDTETLETDRQSLEKILQSKGLATAKVEPPQLVPLGGGTVEVVFPIEPGGFWIIRNLELVGFPVESAAEIESLDLPLKEGGPWDPSRVEPMRRLLEAALHNSGYPEATVTASTTTADHKVSLRFVARPGPAVTIGEITIAGLNRTRPSVVRRTLAIAGFRQGTRYSLRTVLHAQQKLYQLGLFRHVDIVPIPGQEGQGERAYLVRCDEGLQRSYSLGLGWDTENKAHVSLGWSHLNLFGGAHAIAIDTRLSSREQRYRITFREPALPYVHVPGSLTFFRTFERYTSYQQRRRGLFVDIGFHQRRPFRLWGRYQYQIVKPEGSPDVISEIGRENQEARISSITPVAEWDLRDDPFTPTRGLFASLSVQYAFPFLNADSRYIKGFANFSAYGHVLAGTVAAGLRVGLMRPIAAPPSGHPNLQVPVSVRFFAGGSASHRAFSLDKLGIPGQTINDNGNPTGGNALVLLNLEYRRKIKGPVSAVLFSDAGNVWSEPSRIRWGDMRWGIGLGLRLDTPAGPIRLEYAHKINPRSGESAGQWWFAFGTPF